LKEGESVLEIPDQLVERTEARAVPKDQEKREEGKKEKAEGEGEELSLGLFVAGTVVEHTGRQGRRKMIQRANMELPLTP